MTDGQTTRESAEKRFEKARKARQEADANLALFEAEKRAVEQKTARLRALRLARDAQAAELAANTGPKKVAKNKKSTG